MNLNFYKIIQQILENNISPFVSRSQPVDAQSGTNIGMTQGDINNTFPLTIKKINFTKKVKRKKKA